jgi:hypothetical protein
MSVSKAKRQITRREIRALKPELRELIARADFAGFEKFLNKYEISGEERSYFEALFKQFATNALARNWRFSR